MAIGSHQLALLLIVVYAGSLLCVMKRRGQPAAWCTGLKHLRIKEARRVRKTLAAY